MPAGCWSSRFAHRPRADRGFTLIEMIIVVAIIVVLLGLLAPVIGTIEARRQRLACATNLHHVSAGVISYALDSSGALPTHFGGGGPIPFDTFWMRRDDSEFVNLGLLIAYVDTPERFYCLSQDESTSPSIAYDTPQNRWHRKKDMSAAAFGVPPAPMGFPGLASLVRSAKAHDPPEGLNSSYPARSREPPKASPPRWWLSNYTNKVIYSDFIGVDDWPGQGRFVGAIRAPHDSEGYNRLFGDGMVAWVDADAVNALRPVSAQVPNVKQLREYYERLDVLP